MMSYELKYPDVWRGEFLVRGQRAPMKLNYVGGNINIAVSALPKSKSNPHIKISQQVTPGRFPTFKTKKACLLTATPFGRTPKEKMDQVRILKRTFGKYIKTKDSAIGMAALISNEPEKTPYKAYVITPSEVTSRLIVRYAPDWYYSICDQMHFLVIISL
ncbi:protein split ends-like isoform X1 [Argiope bruennichi]|uniref:Msx2-interacting protein like n=1 Tax=Argiope bruennichi TaxID=94029 RepID=A0A8T0EJJ2_ARGBR|nr:protein split ends-like isoform X1 [Argiope bruennichi]KAF8771804.1 Msx2-interacting protein like [Argiope bruennichi]